MDSELIQQRLGMLQSSSPSYPIMASLDLCRRWIYQQGEHKIAQGLQNIKHLREQIQSKLPAIAILEKAANNLCL